MSENFNFATIGQVYEDGVSLIFDGQEEASQKHYKVNTSVRFSPGDRVKILSDCGTYIVEYVVGNPAIDAESEGEDAGVLPTGGSKGQYLRKSSNDDFAMVWEDGDIPPGGDKFCMLTKASAADGDVYWDNRARFVVNDADTSSFIRVAFSQGYFYLSCGNYRVKI